MSEQEEAARGNVSEWTLLHAPLSHTHALGTISTYTQTLTHL